MDTQPDAPSEPTAEVIRRLAADLAALVRFYGGAIRDHLRGLGRDLALAAILVGAALVLGILAVGVAVATLILVVAIWLPAWLASLTVLAVMLILMGSLVLAGVGRVRRRRAAWSARMAQEIRWLESLFPRRG